MNKSELIEVLAARTELSKPVTAQSLELLLDTITTAIAKGDDVALSGFGTFKSAKRAAQVGRNTKTGEALNRAARKK